MNPEEFLKDVSFGLGYSLDDGKIFVKKLGPPVITKKFDNMDDALAFLRDDLKIPSNKFSVIVRYDRGLGIEYKNLPDIEARTLEEARLLAQTEAEKLVQNIKEIRVRPL
jgi:hypothetical protein